jgi:hypothetical protein
MSRETIELQYPVTVDGEEYTVFSLRRPKMRDMKKQQKHKDDLDKATAMIADLAEVSTKVVDELDPVDFTALSDWVGKCMPNAEGMTP